MEEAKPATPATSDTPDSFFIQEENKDSNYHITLFISNDELQIKAICLDSIGEASFSTKLNLSQLVQINKVLSIYESVQEIKSLILYMNKKNLIKLTKAGGIISVEFELTYGNKSTSVKIGLKQNEFDMKEVVMQLCEELGTLKKRFSSFEDYFIEVNGSKILQTIEYDKFVKKSVEEKVHKKVKCFKLLTRASRDGGTVAVFRQKCVNVPFTICLIKLKDGHIFGGFAGQPWVNTGGYKTDDKAFLFSLNNFEAYNCINDGKAVYDNSPYQCIFGDGHDLYLYDNCLTNTTNGVYCTQSAYDYKGRQNALSGVNGWVTGDKIEDVEILQTIFE